MARTEKADVALSEFKKRHTSGVFPCRYQDCSRSLTGFNSAALRSEHENSHATGFKCTDLRCGYYGWPFKTRNTLTNHASKYHHRDAISSIPNSLSAEPRYSQGQRSLFRLGNTSPLNKDLESSVLGPSGSLKMRGGTSLTPPPPSPRLPFGRTALADAIMRDAESDQIRELIERQPGNLNAPDVDGNTPLHLASESGNVEIVRLLLDSKCDIHRKNTAWRTSLHSAVTWGHLEVVKILLEAGLDPKVRDRSGKTAFDYVHSYGEGADKLRAILDGETQTRFQTQRVFQGQTIAPTPQQMQPQAMLQQQMPEGMGNNPQLLAQQQQRLPSMWERENQNHTAWNTPNSSVDPAPWQPGKDYTEDYQNYQTQFLSQRAYETGTHHFNKDSFPASISGIFRIPEGPCTPPYELPPAAPQGWSAQWDPRYSTW